MPRSGTSLIEQIISNHSSVHGGGELDILPNVVENSNWKKTKIFLILLKFIRSEYFSKISKISNKKFITDKLPGNFKWIGFILNAMPEIKNITFRKKSNGNMLVNIYKSEFNNPDMAFTYSQEYIAEFYLLYKDLMNFWKNKYPVNLLILFMRVLLKIMKTILKKFFSN